MNEKELVEALHPLERKVLPFLNKSNSFDDLHKASGLKYVEVMRALQWLDNKKVLKLKTDYCEQIMLGSNGKLYAKQRMPERRVLDELSKKSLSLDELGKKSALSRQELSAAIGQLKKNAAIEFDKNTISLTAHGKKLAEAKTHEEKFLENLKTPVEVDSLNDLQKHILKGMQKRKGLVEVKTIRTVTYQLTDIGKKICSAKVDVNVIDRLTPEMLKTGNWMGKKFRRYDVSINVPSIDGGKRHFARQAIEYAKKIWMDMGFKEMTGQHVQTSFWNFDALFTAQDHPVREMQDTFFIDKPRTGKLPDKKLVESVKSMHEHGEKTGSTGWGGKWSEENSKDNVLRTHTTCLSSATLASLKKEDMPAKFFAVGRCFRNEAVDWCHLAEFNQSEGIVVDPNASFKHLLGYLKIFFKKMGYDKVRFRPAFFPYTEPSVEIDVYHPVHKKWLELGGAGMFRPEVTVPLLGKEVPVLAWGPGFDRVILDYFKLNDIRDLYNNDIKQMREMKQWIW